MNENVNAQNPLNLIDQDIAMENNNQSNPTPEVNNTAATSTQETQSNTTTSTAAAPQNGQNQDIFDKLIWKFVSFLAKVSWQPDPQYWTPNTSSTTATTTNQTDNTQAATTPTTDKIDFNSVMSGVSWFMDKVWQSKVVSNMTWFLDKVWDKIEEKTWINLGTQTSAPEATNTQPTEPQAVPTSTEQVAVAPAQPTEPVQPQTPVQQ